MNPTLYQKVDGAPEWVEKVPVMKTVCVNLRTGEHHVVTEENKREMLAEGEWTTSLSVENIKLLIKAITAVEDLPEEVRELLEHRNNVQPSSPTVRASDYLSKFTGVEANQISQDSLSAHHTAMGFNQDPKEVANNLTDPYLKTITDNSPKSTERGWWESICSCFGNGK